MSVLTKVLELGARFNSAVVCGMAFGADYGRSNSKALRIAFENGNYRAAGRMLDRAVKFPAFDPRGDFNYDSDWSRVQDIAKANPKAGALMTRFDEESERQFREGREAALSAYDAVLVTDPKPGAPIGYITRKQPKL